MITLTSDPETALSVSKQTTAEHSHQTGEFLPSVRGGTMIRARRMLVTTSISRKTLSRTGTSVAGGRQ